MIFLNAEAFIQEAIQSIFAQTEDRWELLLVDDGSTDRSTVMAQEFAQRHPDKVRYVEHERHQNLGMSASRNLGIANARGNYIAFLDADDVWLPNKLHEQVAALEAHPEAGMVYGPTQYWHSWTNKREDREKDFQGDIGGGGPRDVDVMRSLMDEAWEGRKVRVTICRITRLSSTIRIFMRSPPASRSATPRWTPARLPSCRRGR